MTAGADPFAIEIVKNSLGAIGDEMFVSLQRSSHSPIIYETLDFAVGVTDASGELIAQGNGVTGFLGTLDGAVREVLVRFGAAGDLAPGDIVVTNDPYTGGGTHLSDVTLVMPVFHGGELVAFVANKAHWTEVGGKDPGSWTTDATEIYQEGLQLPCIKLFDRGRPNQALLDLIRANVRLPEMTIGDLWAGVAALRVGERRFVSVVERYGLEPVRTAIAALIEHGRRSAGSAVLSLPDGVYEAEDMIDDDGIGNGPFPVRVRVTVDGNRFVCDFTGSHSQVPGPINCTRTGLVSEVRAVFKAITTPDLPTNAGHFAPLEIVCPDGTIFTAMKPAPVSTYWETKRYSCDLVWKAMAPVVPERLPAGHFLSVCGTIVSGPHPETGELFLLVEPLVGGWGAGPDKDGENGQFCVGDGETYNIPVEVTEVRYGVRVERYAFHVEDGGHGRQRGGKGVILEYLVTAERAALTCTFGRHKYPPWGLAGGAEGTRNYVQIVHPDGRTHTSGKTARYPLARGDLVRLVTGTGGGHGNPGDRSPELIEEDLKNGFITPGQAAARYRSE